MSDLNTRINDDLKKAMLARDKELVSVLRNLKSAILYFGVDSGTRDEVTDEQIIGVLRKESKKRVDAATIYRQANDAEREKKENYEKEIIGKYLPKMLEESEVSELVDKAISKIGSVEPKTMGRIIAEVKSDSKNLADGSMIASLVKERMNS